LRDDCEAIGEFHKDIGNYYCAVRTESWKAFSDGGELQWIDNPEMLHQLSVAYARVQQFAALYNKCVDAYYFTGTRGNWNDLLRTTIEARNTAIDQATEVRKHISNTLDIVRRELESYGIPRGHTAWNRMLRRKKRVAL
jgi:hypothetical protein